MSKTAKKRVAMPRTVSRFFAEKSPFSRFLQKISLSSSSTVSSKRIVCSSNGRSRDFRKSEQNPRWRPYGEEEDEGVPGRWRRRRKPLGPDSGKHEARTFRAALLAYREKKLYHALPSLSRSSQDSSEEEEMGRQGVEQRK
jgi:hypothetical protein